jgi:hypothetical protein
MTQVREEITFTKGRVIVRGKTVRRGEAKKAEPWRSSRLCGSFKVCPVNGYGSRAPSPGKQ